MLMSIDLPPSPQPDAGMELWWPWYTETRVATLTDTWTETKHPLPPPRPYNKTAHPGSGGGQVTLYGDKY